MGKREDALIDLQFRGTWTPYTVFDKLEAGEIKPIDLCFLAVVEAHTDAGGCQMGNADLAEWMRCDEADVPGIMDRLEESGLFIVKEAVDGGRRVGTAWGQMARGYAV